MDCVCFKRCYRRRFCQLETMWMGMHCRTILTTAHTRSSSDDAGTGSAIRKLLPAKAKNQSVGTAVLKAKTARKLKRNLLLFCFPTPTASLASYSAIRHCCNVQSRLSSHFSLASIDSATPGSLLAKNEPVAVILGANGRRTTQTAGGESHRYHICQEQGHRCR